MPFRSPFRKSPNLHFRSWNLFLNLAPQSLGHSFFLLLLLIFDFGASDSVMEARLPLIRCFNSAYTCSPRLRLTGGRGAFVPKTPFLFEKLEKNPAEPRAKP